MTRDKVAVAGKDGFFRQVLHVTSRIDPLTAAGGAELDAGIWDVFVRVGSCGWNKETRLGSVRGDKIRGGPGAALLGSPGRLVVPYWTEGHGNLSLDVDQKTNRIAHAFAGLTPADVTVTTDPARLTAALPLHVPGGSEVTLKLTDAASNRSVAVDGVLAERPAGGAELTADVPFGELPDAALRLELTLPAAGREKSAALPLALRAPADGGAVVVTSVAVAAKRAEWRGPTSRSGLASGLRRAVRRIRRALKK
jgi:hypothetical protein